ncbi:PP2C family protein-serine/threonine phosphatase [Paucidesulfovibrio longus]|uniref:PP2C family protein-serine/threonine phosphatase n=1 Tax=Paucidesulfovibrio longus TaxID=889 RepID=UPI0003B77351|nr:GAF domain-containing SpoIIE family protein phosphatase [Paucidesulfovibrio longus]
MDQCLLDRLLARTGVADLVERLGPVRVFAPDGGVLLDGTSPQDMCGPAHEVRLHGRLLGSVAGGEDERAETVAALLRHLALASESSLEARQEEDQFREVILALSSELNLDRLLAKIMDSVTRLLGAERSTLFLHDEERHELWSPVAQGLDVGEIRIPQAAGIAGRVFSTGDPINIPDAYADERFDPETDRRTGYRTRTILCCPVVNKEGRIIGVTQALNKRGGPFSPRDETRLLAFSAQASIAIENAKLYNHMEELVSERTRELNQTLDLLSAELEAAAEYVRRLLPPPQAAGPLRCDWRYVPSSSLGGDAFGYHWLDDEHFAIYLNDVSGHGVGAALLSVSVMNVLHSRMLQDVDYRDPGQVLAALNDAFPMERHNNMFLTMWYGVWNRRERTLTYAGGGHPPALLFGPDGARRLFTHNMLLGCVPGQAYVTDAADIAPGERLLVFSDGVYEIECTDGRIWTFEEFEGFMAGGNGSGKGGPAGTKSPCLDELMRHTQSLAGREGWEDDFSILEIRFD